MADDQRTLVAELAQLAGQLAAVMETETAHLEHNRWDALAVLGPEKSRLSLRYDALMAAVGALPRAALKADPAFAELAAAGTRLDRAARANAFRLSIQIKANQRVAQIIATAARKAASPLVSYGKTRSGFGNRLRDAAPPIAVSRIY